MSAYFEKTYASKPAGRTKLIVLTAASSIARKFLSECRGCQPVINYYFQFVKSKSDRSQSHNKLRTQANKAYR